MAPTKDFKCQKCDKKYCFENGLTAHMSKNHDDNVPNKVTKPTKASKPAPNVTVATAKLIVFKCPKCETKWSDDDILKKHMKRMHAPKNLWTVSSLNTKEFDDLLEEEEDLAMHAEQIEHDIGINASNRVLLQAHKDKSHKKIPRRKCRMCGFIATGLESINDHKQQHERELNVDRISAYPRDVYNFNCTPCQNSFRTHDDLMDHMSKVHLTEDHKNGKRFDKSVEKIAEQSNASPISQPPPCKNGP